MSEWKDYELQELFLVQNGYAFRSSQYVEFREGTLEVLKMGHIERGGGLRKDPKRSFVPRANKLRKWILDKDDIVMAMTDMKDNVVILGVPALVDKNDHYVLNQRVARLKLTFPEANLHFLYNYLKWPDFLLDLQSKANSGVQVNLSTEAIKTSIITLPPLPEQRAIAAVLTSLDDKIDLLHRQNKTLEALAQTLFRHWFVDGVEDDWETVKLGDFFPVITGKKDANFSTEDGKYPFFTCAQKIIFSPDYSFEGKAILLAGNGDFNVKRYDGKFEAYQRTYVLMPFRSEYFGFLYTLIKYYLLDITGHARGSVIRFITKGMITDFEFSMPIHKHSELMEKLETFTKLFIKVDFNSEQIQTLEKLRDSLLPKLMSGEVRVRV